METELLVPRTAMFRSLMVCSFKSTLSFVMQDAPAPMEEPDMPPAAEIPVEKFSLFHKVPDYLYESCPKSYPK